MFEQIPYDHMYENGCRKCGREVCSKKRRSNSKEFIEKAIKKHGNKYDYSLVEYVNNSTKVKIICKEHGVFEQAPANHLVGSGCNKCAYISTGFKSRIKKEDFIKRCNIVHKNKYDYSLCECFLDESILTIICSIHGVFNQKAGKHKRGKGCRKCAFDKVGKINSRNPTGWTITSWNKAGERSNNFDNFKVYIIRCWNEEESFFKIGRTFLETKKRFRSKKLMPYNYEIINEFIFDTAKEAFDKETKLKRLHKEYKYNPKISFDGQHECFDKINLHL